MKKNCCCYSIITLLTLSLKVCFAATDTIGVKRPLNTTNLKTGLNKYMVYYLYPASPKKITFWYWEREIKKKEDHGTKVFEIIQHWYGADSSSYRYIRSLNNAGNFYPVFHQEEVKGKIKAYNWSSDNIKGDKNVKDNIAANFALNFDRPNFNWNLDIETLEMLPLASGKTFAINFYDAGLDPPRYVSYTVIGTEEINTTDGHTVNCWKLFTEGKMSNDKTYKETYWISKKNHEFLKEIDEFGGNYRYKIKLPEGAPDAAAMYFQD